MANPKISIVIPTYNREKFIAECIRSAQNQTYSNIEIIVSDNASTDRTWDICQELAKHDHRITLIKNDINLGPVRNWMQGINKATGEFCKVLFSDDGLSPDCLQKMMPRLADPQVGLVYCTARVGATVDTATQLIYQLPDSRRVRSNSFVDMMIAGQAPVSPGAILIRTSDIRKNLHLSFPTAVGRAYDKNGAGPDAMIALLTSRAYDFIEYIHEPLVFFRAHADSFTVSNTNNEVANGYQSVIPYFIKRHHGESAWLRYVSRAWRQARRKATSPVPMRKFLMDHEGQGSLSECLALIGHMAWRPIRKRLRGGHFYLD